MFCQSTHLGDSSDDQVDCLGFDETDAAVCMCIAAGATELSGRKIDVSIGPALGILVGQVLRSAVRVMRPLLSVGAFACQTACSGAPSTSRHSSISGPSNQKAAARPYDRSPSGHRQRPQATPDHGPTAVKLRRKGRVFCFVGYVKRNSLRFRHFVKAEAVRYAPPARCCTCAKGRGLSAPLGT